MECAPQTSSDITQDGCKNWEKVLVGEKEQPYFQAILSFIKQERAKGKIIYPPQKDIFNALKFTPFDV